MISDSPAQHKEGYEQFFGFSDPPFSLSANPRFRFPSAAHEDALLQVMYAMERREPVIVVTGDIGLGKTLLCRTVVDRLPHKTFLSVIDDPLLSRDDLLKRMLEDFGLISAERAGSVHASRHDLVHTMNTFLSSLAPLEAHAVVIIDEAQHVQPDVIEQIRLLANTSDGRGTLLQIVLVGQPSLQELLARPELQQLRQRVTRSVSLTALTDAEVKQYIVHRLAVARKAETDSLIPGADDLALEVARWNASRQPVTFSEEAVRAVTRISHGIPRLVNLLCDRALEVAFAERSRSLDAATVQNAARLLHLADAPGDFARVVPTAAASAIATGPATEPATEIDSEIVFEPGHELSGENASGFEAAAGENIESHAPARTMRYVAAAAALVLAIAVGWFGLRALHRDAAARGTTDRPAPPRLTSSGAVPAAQQTPPVQPPSEANVAAPVGAPAAAPAPPTPSAPTAVAATTESFEIVVASFHTEARANEVVTELTGLGQPAHTRLLDGWQQVVAGPFANEAAAEDAQRQLDRNGFSGTQVGRVAP